MKTLNFPESLTANEIASKQEWQRLSDENDSRLSIDLEVYYILDGRSKLQGWIHFPEPLPLSVVLQVSKTGNPDVLHHMKLDGAGISKETAFTIPLQELGGGYFRLEARDSLLRRCDVYFSIREERASESGECDYGRFLEKSIDHILAAQMQPLGNTKFVTTEIPVTISYRSISHREGNRFKSALIKGTRMHYATFLADLEIWPVLEGLSEITGNPYYQSLVDDMLNAWESHGFDSRSGLLRWSEECGFDVSHETLCSTISPRHVPTFKPFNGKPRVDMYLDRFWKRFPVQTHRWLRATYPAHVTDQDNMDFNRVAFFYFDAEDKSPSQKRKSGHYAFESCAASLIYFWASCWVHAGDGECLQWAKRMTKKWEVAQHAKSGLIPNFFNTPSEEDAQTACHWAETRCAAVAAELFLRTAHLLQIRSSAETLCIRLHEMGERLALGVAKYGYDASRRCFREHLHLDGRPYEETARYCFRTQEEKDDAMRFDPLMAEVAVYDGAGLFRQPNYYEICAGSNIPYNLSGAAVFCRNPELIECLQKMATDALDEALKIKSAFTLENRWTFRASGWYVELCLRLFEITGDRLHLEQARQLADREIKALSMVHSPSWWRMAERTVWLDALLHLSKIL